MVGENMVMDKGPGPIRLAFAEAIGYVRFFATLGGVVFITWLAVESAKKIAFFKAVSPAGQEVVVIPLEAALPLGLLLAVLTALVGVLGGLIAGPNPLAVIAEKLVDKK